MALRNSSPRHVVFHLAISTHNVHDALSGWMVIYVDSQGLSPVAHDTALIGQATNGLSSSAGAFGDSTYGLATGNGFLEARRCRSILQHVVSVSGQPPNCRYIFSCKVIGVNPNYPGLISDFLVGFVEA
jgi:hypothetical protein